MVSPLQWSQYSAGSKSSCSVNWVEDGSNLMQHISYIFILFYSIYFIILISLFFYSIIIIVISSSSIVIIIIIHSNNIVNF